MGTGKSNGERCRRDGSYDGLGGAVQLAIAARETGKRNSLPGGERVLCLEGDFIFAAVASLGERRGRNGDRGIGGRGATNSGQIDGVARGAGIFARDIERAGRVSQDVGSVSVRSVAGGELGIGSRGVAGGARLQNVNMCSNDGSMASEDAALKGAGLRGRTGERGVWDRGDAGTAGKGEGADGQRRAKGQKRHTEGTATGREKGLHGKLQIFAGKSQPE